VRNLRRRIARRDSMLLRSQLETRFISRLAKSSASSLRNLRLVQIFLERSRSDDGPGFVSTTGEVSLITVINRDSWDEIRPACAITLWPGSTSVVIDRYLIIAANSKPRDRIRRSLVSGVFITLISMVRVFEFPPVDGRTMKRETPEKEGERERERERGTGRPGSLPPPRHGVTLILVIQRREGKVFGSVLRPNIAAPPRKLRV